MKKFLLALGVLSMLAFTACDDSASSSGDNNGSGTKSTSDSKRSFPANGDEGFYCEVTDGTNADGSYWKQIKVNIPKYKGHVEKFTFDENGNGTQYYEDAHFYITPYEKTAMCLEFEDGIKESSHKRNYTETYCGNGFYYFVISFQNLKLGTLQSQVASYEEDCKDYERKWRDGDYDEVIERRTSK